MYCYYISKLNFYIFCLVHAEKMVKRKPVFGAIPTLNMPIKSHDSVTNEREPRNIVKDYEAPSIKKHIYETFNEFCSRVKKLKRLDSWIVEILDDRVILKFVVKQLLLPKFEIHVDDSLGFAVLVFGCCLPEHTTFIKYTNVQSEMLTLLNL